MLVNKTVEFFLSEAAGWTRDLRGQAADWDEMSVTKSPGRQRARSGQGPDEMPAGAEAGTRCRRGPRLSRRRCRRPNHMGR